MMASRNTLDMTNGPIFRKLLLYAYPLILNGVINTLYGVADKIIAGQFIGDNAMAAVGICTPPIGLIFNTSVSVASGVGVLCGNFIGARKDTELRECMHTTPLTGAIIGLLMGILGFVLTTPLLVVTNTPESVFSDAYTYMVVRMLGLPFAIANTFCNNILTAHGDTKRITFSGIVSGLLNVAANIVFVTIIPWGVAGIAFATVLSQILPFLIKIYILFSPKDCYRLKFSEMKIRWKYIKQIFSIGIPTGMNSLAFSFANMMLQSSVNTFGPTIIAGNACADTLINLVAMIPTHMNSACSCAVAQCYGAKNFQRIKDTVNKGIIGTNIMIAIVSVIVTIFARPVLRLFTDNPDVATAGIPKMMFSIWGYLIYNFVMVYGGALKGMRRSSTMMILNFLGICLPRLLWIWFVFPFFSTPNILYLIYPISYVTSAIPTYFAYHRILKKQLLLHQQNTSTEIT